MAICRNPNCAKENPDDITFCKYCGRKLKEPKNYSKLPMQMVAVLGGMLVLLLIVKALFSLGGSIGINKQTNNQPNKSQNKVSTIPNQKVTSKDGLNYKFVFVKGQGTIQEVYLHDSNGTVKKITNSGLANSMPSLSPDGKKVAFERNEKNVVSIYVINTDGTGEKKLTEGHAPSWQPDGSKIIFYNKDVNSISKFLYSINVNGTGLTKLTDTTDSYYLARYSPDGNKIAMTKYSLEGWGIYTVGKDLSGRKTLVLNKNRTESPSWSSDGNKITYQSQKDGTFAGTEIYTVDLNQNVLALTNNTVPDMAPSYTPDGKIIFTREEAGAMNLYIINGDGTGEKQIMSGAGYASVSLK